MADEAHVNELFGSVGAVLHGGTTLHVVNSLVGEPCHNENSPMPSAAAVMYLGYLAFRVRMHGSKDLFELIH